ncbi:hypothetical protein HOO68_05870 [Candidatus Gracilibacteria bacterium]|nr:hypothetical protein [Candidatus Gracilibacteria bacterium]
MGDLGRAIGEAIDVVAGIGGDLELEIEETPGKNTPANRLRLKNILKIDDLLQKAMKLADRSQL